MKRNGRAKVKVSADGMGVVSHAGAALLPPPKLSGTQDNVSGCPARVMTPFVITAG